LSIKRGKLEQHLANLLNVGEFDDLGPNGLQVEGKSKIEKIVFGVSGCVELFEKAIQEDADAIIVHHGIIWSFERPVYKGGYKKRVKLLLENDINLFGFHLPLDVHKKVGNNAVISEIMELKERQRFAEYKGTLLGIMGRRNISANNAFEIIKEEIKEDPIIFPYGPDQIESMGIISGGADKMIKKAVRKDLDLFLTGEISEHIMHYAKEEGIHFVAAGHHNTERFGVQALQDHLKNEFDVETQFVDIPNPA